MQYYRDASQARRAYVLALLCRNAGHANSAIFHKIVLGVWRDIAHGRPSDFPLLSTLSITIFDEEYARDPRTTADGLLLDGRTIPPKERDALIRKGARELANLSGRVQKMSPRELLMWPQTFPPT